jgi:hypothetical protein
MSDWLLTMNRSAAVGSSAQNRANGKIPGTNSNWSGTATLRSGRPGEGERSFRYAPLSSGLDIARKPLGQHEIATTSPC